MALTTMYEGMNNSPQTDITAAITASDTVIPVSSVSVFPAAPNLATLGSDENAEVIRYNGIDGSTLTGCERGFGGTTASPWVAGTVISRQITKYDLDTLVRNIIDLNTRKLEAMDSTPTAGSTNPVQSNGIAAAISQVTAIANSKVSKSGDTMTNTLNLQSSTFNPSVTSAGNSFFPIRVKDKNGGIVLNHQLVQDDATFTDTRRFGFFLFRTVNGNEVSNAFQICVDATGKRRYKVTDPAMFVKDVLDGNVVYHVTGSIPSGSTKTFSADEITSKMRVVNCVFGTPANVTSNVSWTTADGSITFTGTFTGATTVDFDLVESNSITVS